MLRPDTGLLPATRAGRLVSLPAVRIGACVPDATTSILLQMVAILQHAPQLANTMAEVAAMIDVSTSLSSSTHPVDNSNTEDLIGATAGATALVPPASASAVIEASSREVHRRVHHMHQQVGSARGVLIQFRLL